MSMKIRKLTLYSLLLNLFLILFFIGKRTYYYFSSGPSDSDKAYSDLLNKGRTQTLNALPLDSSNIVFIGDSQTEKFPIDEMFNNPRLRNRGIGQNTSAHILGRIGPIIAAHPAKIFLQMGLNDIAEWVSTDSILTNYDRVIKMIRAGSPQTQIYIQSTFPLTGIRENARWETQVEKLNSRLKDYCRQAGITFIDIFPRLYKDNGLDTAFTWDGCHLNSKGYAIWKQSVDSLVD